MKLEFSRQFFEKYSNIKFDGHHPTGSPVVPCGRTDMTKLIDAFRNCANAPKKKESKDIHVFWDVAPRRMVHSYLTLKKKALLCFQTPVNSLPININFNIPRNLNRQQHRCHGLKARKRECLQALFHTFRM